MRTQLVVLTTTAALAAAAPAAHAFCGFYVGGAGAELFNNASQVVLMRHGTTTILSMENNYQGPPDRFAMVIPVPVVVKEDQVKTLSRDLFSKIDVLGAPRLVEYWEQDPCLVEPEPKYEEGADYALEDSEEGDSDGEPDKVYHVKIEAKFSVAEYDIVVLSATDSTGLDHWLHDHKYEIPAKAEPLLRPYVASGTKFFVAKVDPKKVTFVNGMATLSPLRVSYDSADFNLPIRLGIANSSGTQDLIVNILSPTTRYEVANYPNVTIPTNLTVKEAVRGRFGEFYAALFDHTLEKVPHAVVTEYAWSAGSCDPCPGPTLDPTDIATLGGDVLDKTYGGLDAYSYTLTRLHARYGVDLADDLVFRAVQPIEGGRGIPDEKGNVSGEVVTASGSNDFQGRYMILHFWEGALACPAPRRGNWGGPWPDQQIAGGSGPIAATNTAFAPRGQVALGTLVTKDVPQIGVLASEGATLPNPVKATQKPHSCGCSAQDGTFGAGVVIFAAALGARRRKRRSAK